MNAYRAECEALLHARSIGLTCRPVPVIVASDCSSALGSTHGQSVSPASDWISETAISLMFAGAAHGQHTQSIWIPAHEACFLNGLADALAHAGATGGTLLSIRTHTLLQEARENRCSWLWLLGSDRSIGRQLPSVDAAGTWSLSACQTQIATLPSWEPKLAPAPSQLEAPCQLRIVQYNCLSLRGHGSDSLIEAGAKRHRVHLMALQETRQSGAQIRSVGNFWVVSAPCTSQGIVRFGLAKVPLPPTRVGRSGGVGGHSRLFTVLRRSSLCWQKPEGFASHVSARMLRSPQPGSRSCSSGGWS